MRSTCKDGVLCEAELVACLRTGRATADSKGTYTRTRQAVRQIRNHDSSKRPAG